MRSVMVQRFDVNNIRSSSMTYAYHVGQNRERRSIKIRKVVSRYYLLKDDTWTALATHSLFLLLFLFIVATVLRPHRYA